MVIKEYKNKHGATIQIDDAAYRDKSSEELKKVRENINKTATRLMYAQTKKRLT
ncbi:MAG: hypothetical protein SOR93_14175 [Clostridiales Family XIII bacterium]|uniref:hypothetical protein n=1 Tax=Hominibacterium faecale TaxID=2839743 RepID=UPI0022B2973D|nr:hypothetical protein [Hominibacterium faecale]MCI7301000.1 hypothetical protein [Clostridia bacterium]MDY3012385.1 hypothetical protein [Clostridiales Family XIII bacterium]